MLESSENSGRHWLSVTVADGGYVVEAGSSKAAVFPDSPAGRAKVRKYVKGWIEAITAPPADASAEPASAGNGEG